jgi:chitodextrinase
MQTPKFAHLLAGLAVLALACTNSTTQNTQNPQPDTEIPADEESPAWAADGAVQFLGVSENALTVLWSAATDNVGVVAYHVYQDDVLLASLDGQLLSLQVNQLTPGGSVAFRVEAADAAGNVSSGGPSATVDLGDDTAPFWGDDSLLSTSNVTAQGVELSWTGAGDNVGVTGYKVYQDNVEIAAAGGASTSYTATGLDPWRTYVFRVEAHDAGSLLSSDGPSVSVKTGDESAPTWPAEAELVFSNVTETSLSLGWDSAQDDVEVTAYQVLQDSVELAVLDGATTWLSVADLSPWTEYTFEVIARDAAGNESASSLSVTVSTPDDTVPQWPDGAALLPSDSTDSSITLGWATATDNVAITGYRLYQDNVEIGAYDGATTSATVEGLGIDENYVFRVEAEDAAGHLSSGGPTVSVDLSDKTAPAWPADASCVDSGVTPISVTLDWSAATDNVGVAGYQVVANDTVWATTDGETVSAEVTGLTPMTSYAFTIVATDGAGNATTDGPGVTVNTPDYPAPAWPSNATLDATQLTQTALTLDWSDLPASEPAVAYQVFQDDVLINTVEMPTSSLSVAGLTPKTSYVFRIEALGPTGKVSAGGPSKTVTTPDYAPPAWPANSSLVESNVTETSLTLTWSAVSAGEVVSAYEVSQDGSVIETVTAPTTTFNVTGLSAGTTYTFGVEAVGPTDLTSTSGPKTTVTTPDNTLPTWPSGATVTAANIGTDSADVSWTPALDNVGITGYDVLVDGNSAATVDGQTTTVSLQGLTPESSYAVSVLARDGANNWTATGPSNLFDTLSGDALTDEDVFNGLSTLCSVCHSAGATGYFASLSQFQSLVVQDPVLITPGDPANSLFIKVMEGKGNSPYTTMPLGAQSFKQQSSQGKTSITFEAISDWVTNMPSN